VQPVSASICLLTSVMMPARIGGHQRVDVRFDERAGVELLVAQALIEEFLLGFHLFARGIIVPINR